MYTSRSNRKKCIGHSFNFVICFIYFMDFYDLAAFFYFHVTKIVSMAKQEIAFNSHTHQNTYSANRKIITLRHCKISYVVVVRKKTIHTNYQCDVFVHSLFWLFPWLLHCSRYSNGFETFFLSQTQPKTDCFSLFPSDFVCDCHFMAILHISFSWAK